MMSTEKVLPSTGVHRQRHAVERDRSFGGDEAGEWGRRAKRQRRAVEKIVAADEFGNAVDMAADHMAAELVAKPQGPFEIEPGAAPPRASAVVTRSVSAAASTAKARAIAGAAALHHGQADARTGDRSADVDAVGIVAAGNLQPAQAFGLFFNLKNFA